MKWFLPLKIAVRARVNVIAHGNTTPPCRARTLDLRATPGLDCGPWPDGTGGAFIEPTVINGKVYVATNGQVAIFGI